MIIIVEVTTRTSDRRLDAIPLILYNNRKYGNVRRIKSHFFPLVLQLPLPNPLKPPGIKSRMKMQLEQHRQAMLQLHLSVQLILEAWRYYHDHKKEIKRYV